MNFSPSACAEFPNDNPDLHDGAVWVCTWTRARPEAQRPAPSTAQRPTPSTSDAPRQTGEAATEPQRRAPAVQPAPNSSRHAPLKPAPRILEARPSWTTAPPPVVHPAALDEEDAPKTRPEPVIARSKEARQPSSSPTPVAPRPAAAEGGARASQQTDAIATQPTISCIEAVAPGEELERVEAGLEEAFDADIADIAERLDAAFEEEPAIVVQEFRFTSDTAAEFDADDEEELVSELQRRGVFARDAVEEEPAPPQPAPVTVSPELVTASPVMVTASVTPPPSSQVVAVDLDASDPPEDACAALDCVDEDSDPFVEELQALMTGDACGATPSTSSPEAVEATQASPVAPPAATQPKPDPLILEDFLCGQKVTPAPKAAAPAQQLNPLQLDLDLDLNLNEEGPRWQALVAHVSRDLMSRGATRAAALLPALLDGERVNLSRLPQTVQLCLIADGIAEGEAGRVESSADFKVRARRMRRGLVDQRMDSETLTRWFASVVRALLAAPQSEEELLREWGESGVTAALERAA